MTVRRAWAPLLWLGCVAFAAIVVARAHYITDLSAFLPANPTPTQQLLVDQLRDGPASRLILFAIEGGDAAARTRASALMVNRLRKDTQFSMVNNGAADDQQSDREFLFKHRYLLSESITAERFSAAGLHAAIEDTIDNLASPAGLLFKSLLPRDPTGELLNIIDQLSRTPSPKTQEGVWVSDDGTRCLGLAQTTASGSDSDAQRRASDAMRAAFAAAVGAAAPGASAAANGLQLKLTGPGIFAVAARAKIETAAVRLSIASGILVVALLLVVYRSLPALGLGLMPVASGALVGIAAVALGFGAVHGVTLGFGVTLIGESVDYSIYFFIQSSRQHGDAGAHSWQQLWWPTIRLGMLTSVCGFASLLPSGFPGLKQLGLYSVSGLIAAALVTRYVLPTLLPAGFVIRDVTPMGDGIARVLVRLRGMGSAAVATLAAVLVALSIATLYQHRESLWNRELAALSPISTAEQNFDARVRADLGAADVRDLVIVSGPDLESVLRSAEHTARALQPLVDAGVIGGFESPADYLPSLATQEARRSSLPGAPELRANLQRATMGLPIRSDRLLPFLEDIEATRHAPLVTARDLTGTSLNAGFQALILHQSERWNALLPLRASAVGGEIDLSRVATTLEAGNVHEALALDLKQQSDALYAGYLGQAIRYSLAGLVALTALLLIALRSLRRVARVLSPLALAVLTVAAGLAVCNVQLTILHLVGLLLIVAVGSNYALFFDRQENSADAGGEALTLASLLIANCSTVIGFGLLSFSRVPVLVALGTTVAPGTFLALLFAAILSPRRGSSAAAAHA
ncbi:MAG TPA: MMPL family transporter [Steroidobacteraceae bacterium]|jgi:predicted exporter|nr:MMPL family transporter [Steroidobacteraceae bacterium]